MTGSAEAPGSGSAILGAVALLASAEEKRRALKLAFYVVGIVSSLLCYGVLQERIMTQVRCPH